MLFRMPYILEEVRIEVEVKEVGLNYVDPDGTPVGCWLRCRLATMDLPYAGFEPANFQLLMQNHVETFIFLKKDPNVKRF
jgi:hypothetical protein